MSEVRDTYKELLRYIRRHVFDEQGDSSEREVEDKLEILVLSCRPCGPAC